MLQKIDRDKIDPDILDKLSEIKRCCGSSAEVGAMVCDEKNCFMGHNIKWTRVVGSTCAEKHAMNLMSQGDSQPLKLDIFTVGRFDRPGWSNSKNVCFPCGVCLELFLEYSKLHDISPLEIIFYSTSWDLSTMYKSSLADLMPTSVVQSWSR